MFLNYDFFKLQVYNKNTLISNFKSNDFLFNNGRSYIIKYFEQIEYINKMFLDYLKTLSETNYSLIHDKKEEIKQILIDLKTNDLNKNFEIIHNNKKYVYIVNKETSFDENIDNIFILIGNALNNESIKKIDYTYLCNGFFNLSLNINKKYIKMFKNTINIGYNSSSNKTFIGISIGIPLYNNLFSIYKNNEELPKDDDFLQKLSDNYIFNCNKNIHYYHKKIILNKTLNEIKENFYLLNLIKFDNDNEIDLIKFDNNFFVSIQDMKDYLNNMFSIKEMKDMNKNIYLNENNYLLIDIDSIDLYILMYFQKLFYQSFNDYISKQNFIISEKDKHKLGFFYNQLKLKFTNEEKLNKNMIDKNETLGNFLAINVKQEKLKIRETEKNIENDIISKN